ncbi:hypothetical protein H5J25_16055 [Sphingomonas aliaeris]|uniref:Uncharacterized protein n=1 Tax=Sphingomonas aliaeris TaxID=2759526 RepID=A0A974S3Z3_9SPHN|nr:hypothetical protein [Sphingomonas aliaeris]QQV76884.1 hypothetical protein H5J25_16055 [Sphingomonas aliaeris]
MTDPDTLARNRYLAIVASRPVAAAGAVFGLVLLSRGISIGQKILGTAIVISAMIVMAVVPAALARRWRTPPEG